MGNDWVPSKHILTMNFKMTENLDASYKLQVILKTFKKSVSSRRAIILTVHISEVESLSDEMV